VAGQALATRLALFPGAVPGDDLGGARGVGGSRVALLSAPALERMATMYPLGLPPQQVFVLRGTFELEPAYDEDHVFVGLE
jgi:lipoprotein-releasing system permease protein